MTQLISAGFALCAVVAALWLGRALGLGSAEIPGAQPSADRAPSRDIGWRWRAWRALVGPLARRLGPRLPRRWVDAARAALECSDLDDCLEPAQACATLLLCAALAAGAWLAPSMAAGDFAAGGAMIARAAQLLLAAAAGAILPCLLLRDRIRKRQAAVARDLPGYLDLLTLGLEAGCAFGAALQIAVQRSPASPLRAALERALQEMRAGRSRGEALLRASERLDVPSLSAAVAAIVQAESTGVSLAPVIRAQALSGTQQRFERAEKRAMEAPVKMLLPLVLCIFPCTFIVIGFPIAVRLLWGA